MQIKIVFFSLGLFFFYGCTQTTYVPYTPQKKEVQKQFIEPLHVKKSGIIKGHIKSLYFDDAKSLWIYEVESSDTTNGKLPHITFSTTKMIAHKGDRIYAVVKDEKLMEHFLIDAQSIQYKSEPVEEKKIQKRTKARKTPWIEVPKSESINLD